MRMKQALSLRDDLVRHMLAKNLQDHLPKIICKPPAVNTHAHTVGMSQNTLQS